MSEQGGTFMQMIGGVASEKCSSCQLVDLKMNEVWFGVHRLKSGVSQTKPPAGSDLPVRSWVKIPISPTACGLWWKVYFHPDLPGSHKNSPIFTTATPPRSHNQNLFCVGSDGYIRAQWIPTPLVKAAIVMIEHSPSRRWRKSMPEASAKALSTARFLLLLCCLGHILLPLSGKSICTEVPVQWEWRCFTWLILEYFLQIIS